MTFNQGVAGSRPARPTLDNNQSVNDFVNKILAMVHAQENPQEITEYLTLGNLQLGTPRAKQQWIDEFLASRRQGLSMRTLEFYRDCLYQAIDIELTAKGINNWLTNLSCGNAKVNYYRVIKVFCNWLHKSKKILKNPITFVDKPKASKRILPAITVDQLVILVCAVDNLRDRCILRFLFDSGCRLDEVVKIKDITLYLKRGHKTSLTVCQLYR